MKTKLHILTFLVVGVPAAVFAQGPLTPPGVPGPVMKTLDQVEPRTPISSLPFTIDKAGSYYFTGNLEFTDASGDAITVAVSNVTLDLMGFTLSSSNSVTGDAIRISAELRNIAVRNGVIAGNTLVNVKGSAPNQTWTVLPAGFNAGINAVSNEAASLKASSCHFSHLRVSGCRTAGLECGRQAVVEHVTATQNGVFGIKISDDGNVTNCTASFNGNTGIFNFYGSVSNCAASSNGNNGIAGASVANSRASGNDGYGIDATDGSVSNCTAIRNGTGISATSVANSVATRNRTHGIVGDLVTTCVARLNGSSGIVSDSVTNSGAFSNGNNGINSSGVVAFCRAGGNNTNNNGSVDISAPGATRTGNNPTP